MRSLLGSLALVCASCATPPAQAAGVGLKPDELARLRRGETIIREQTVEHGEHRYVGGITYTMVEAPVSLVASTIDNVESLGRVLPRTKRARLVGAVGNDRLLELVQGNALVEASYTVRMRPGPHEARFWLDPSRPHAIEDAWGFFRYDPLTGPTGDPHVLLTYGVLVDIGPGIVRQLFEERIRVALLSVPQLVRRRLAESPSL